MRSPLAWRHETRLALLLATASGVSYFYTMATQSPEQFGLASAVYVTAAEAWLEGADFYAVSPEHLPGYRFLYPPIVLLLFVPYAALGGMTLAYAGQSLLNLLTGGAIVLVLLRMLDRRDIELARVDRWLLAGFVFISPYGMPVLINGQTTMWVALGLAVGIEAVDRDRERVSGLAFGVAATLKVFPAALGLWLLRLRAWRAVAAALALGIGALLAGVLIFGVDVTEQYVTEVLLGRYERETYERVGSPSSPIGGVRRQLAGVGVAAEHLTLASAAVLAPVLAAGYRSVETDFDRLAAVLVTVIATLMFVPLQPLYFALLYVPVVLLLFRLEGGAARYVLIAGVLLTVMMVDYEPALGLASVLPASLFEPVESVLTAFYRVFLPTDVGMWLLAIAAIIVQVAPPGRWWRPRGSDPEPAA